MYNYKFMNDNYMDNYRNNMMSNPMLTTPSVGYDRGNMFNNLYDQYKNYKVDVLRGNNEKERLYLELSRMCFAAHEINLYLDLYPDDMSMLRLFNDYRNKSNELIKEYENKYGPLSIKSDVLEKSPFMWEMSPWPWEEKI